MKTPLKLSIILLLSCFILSSAQCEKEEANSLPLETQEGKKTFGCLINGELFTNINKQVYFGVAPLTAYYSRSMNTLSITAQKQIGNLGFNVINPKENESGFLNRAGYSPQNRELCVYFHSNNTGEITLTKFDTINMIVSGRFHFDAQCCDAYYNPVGNSIIKVTEGRFDLRLEMVDN